MRNFGMFHRNEATYQTVKDAKLQVASQEMWGRTPKNGFDLAVQAFKDGGIKQERRIEFSTDIEPKAETPFEAWWYRDDPGVETRKKDGEEFACIAVEISLNTIV